MNLDHYAQMALKSCLNVAAIEGLPPGPVVLFEGDASAGTIVLAGFIEASEETQREAADLLRKTLREQEATRYAIVGAAWAIESRPDGVVPPAIEEEPDRFEVIFVYAEDAEQAIAFVVRPIIDDDGKVIRIEKAPEEAEAIPNKLLSGILKRAETIQ